MGYTCKTVEIVYDDEDKDAGRVEVSESPEDPELLSISSYDGEGTLASEVTVPLGMAPKVAQAILRQQARMRASGSSLVQLVKDAEKQERREKETDPPPGSNRRPPSGQFSVALQQRRSLTPPGGIAAVPADPCCDPGEPRAGGCS